MDVRSLVTYFVVMVTSSSMRESAALGMHDARDDSERGAPEHEGCLSQIAMCTTDLPFSARVFVEGLGFAHAGGRPLWGERMATIQELPTGADSTCMIWWLVGAQDFFQLELFSHTTPAVRPPAEPRTAADAGWAWWGVTVPDVDAVLAALARLSVPAGEVDEVSGRRHFQFVEPASAATIHVFEGAAVEQDVHYPFAPHVTHVGLTVADVGLARRIFGSVGFLEAPPGADAEVRSWVGGGGDTAVLDGPVRLVVSECGPGGRPVDRAALLSDQGIMNIGLGFRRKPALDAAVAVLKGLGATHTTPPPEVAGGMYFRLPDGISMEVLLTPRELDRGFGFAPLPAFPPVATWPTPGPWSH